MNFTKTRALAAVLSLLALLFVVPSQAQTTNDYDDEELKKFAKVVVDVITIQQESQMQMISTIEQHEMSIQRFNEMMIESQDRPLDEVDGSQEEKEAFTDISIQIMAIQEEMEDRLIESIQREGFTIEQYEQLLRDYQHDPELQQRVQDLVE
jgi:hypothetical protein